MLTQRDAWNALQSLIDRVTSISEELTVFVVANRRQEGALTEDERATEHLSEGEANQILIALRSAGFRTRYFDGELAFLKAAVMGELGPHSAAKQLVFSLAQSGCDPARKALVPSFCSLLAIPTCNSDGYAMALARNKLHVHCILKKLGLPTPPSWAYNRGTGWLLGRRPPRNTPLIAKASRESASIGLSDDSVGLLSSKFEAMLARKAVELGQPLIVQKLVEGYELEVPLVELNGQPAVLGVVPLSLAGDPRLGRSILNFEVVAYDGYGFAEAEVLDPRVIGAVRDAAVDVFTSLGLSGLARVDFRATEAGEIAVIDVATSPHIVYHSSFAHLFRKMGLRHQDLLAALVAVNADRLGWL